MLRLGKLLGLITICIALVVLSTGQEKFGTELVELMVIQGIGIDKTENGYRASIQTINNTQNSFINGQGSSDNVSKQYFSDGENVAEALDNAVKKSGKMPMYAHNRVIVIGEDTAMKDLAGTLDFFIRDYNTKPTVLLAVARGSTAEEIINAQVGSDTLISQRLENILDESENYGETDKIRMYEVVNYIKDPFASLLLPAISLEKKSTPQTQGAMVTKTQSVYVNGMAVFDKNNDFKGYLDEQETFGTVILNDRLKKGLFSVALDNGNTAVLEIEGLYERTKVRYENSRLIIDVKLTLHCDLAEYDSDNFAQVNKDVILEIVELSRKKIIQITQTAIDAAQKKYQADIFRYGRRLWIWDNKAFKSIGEKEYPQKFSEAEINVSAKVAIRRSGEELYF